LPPEQNADAHSEPEPQLWPLASLHCAFPSHAWAPSQVPGSSESFGTFVHVPREFWLRLHVMQSVEQDDSQQTPSTQKPDEHAFSSEHASPVGQSAVQLTMVPPEPPLEVEPEPPFAPAPAPPLGVEPAPPFALAPKPPFALAPEPLVPLPPAESEGSSASKSGAHPRTRNEHEAKACNRYRTITSYMNRAPEKIDIPVLLQAGLS